MLTNTPLEKLRAGEPAFGLAMASSDPLIAEVMGRAGADWVWMDEQHGSWDRAAMYRAIQIIQLAGATVIVRPGSNEFFRIGRALDAGALGVIVPMVNSAEHAQAAVFAAKYPPRGGRSSGGVRLRFMGGDYASAANDNTLVAVMVETAEALGRVPEIAGVEGVDAIFIGPGDLSVSMGVPLGSDELEEALLRILREANGVGTPAGIACGNPEDARKRADQGFQLVTAGSESGMIFAGIAHMMKTVGLAD